MVETFCKVLALSAALCSLPIFAQGNASAPAGSPGCGEEAAKFAVNTSKGSHSVQPEAGKALVYFIEDDSNFNSNPKPTTRAGLDGQWVGATHGNSFLYLTVDPGVHHLCASWQGRGQNTLLALRVGISTGYGKKVSAYRFTAEAGGTYYFLAKNILIFSGDRVPDNTLDMTLTQLNSDQGQLMVDRSALSASKKK